MMKRFSVLLALMLLAMMAGGCLAPQTEAWSICRIISTRPVLAGNEQIADDDWKKFCDEVVAKAFPNGYSEMKMPMKKMRDHVKARNEERVLTIIATAGPETEQAFAQVTIEYKKRFRDGNIRIERAAGQIHLP